MKFQHTDYSRRNSPEPARHRFICTARVWFAQICLLFAGSVYAGLDVMDTTISWPADGWYQVQRASDYSDVCEGGRSCDVPPGVYNVINHTTGQRFEGIEVPPADVGVVVSGNTIAWPDDGWYQVQSATDYTSLCEGGSSCEVPDGNYIVINHTTGQRFEGIVVPQRHDGVVVSGNTITWPDDGWYQVQSAVDYTSFCEGVRFCEVSDGVYHVINHTTGKRFENIVVGNVGHNLPGEVVALTVDNHAAVLSMVFDLFNGSYLNYGQSILSLPDFSVPRYNEPPEAISPVEVANQTPEVVDCVGGGTATFNYIQSGFTDITYGWDMQFDDCNDVDTIYDGQLRRSSNSAFETASSTGLRIERGGKITHFSGLLDWQARNARFGDSRSWRLSDFSLQMMDADGTLLLDVIDGNSTLNTFEPRFRNLEGNLTVRSSDTDNHTLSVSVTARLEQEVPAGPDIESRFETAQFDSGVLSVTAGDGSSLLLDAGNGTPETADITISSTDGSSTEFEQPWSIWAHQLTCGRNATGEQGCL